MEEVKQFVLVPEIEL